MTGERVRREGARCSPCAGSGVCRERAAGASVVLASCWELCFAGRGEKKQGSSLGLHHLPGGAQTLEMPT